LYHRRTRESEGGKNRDKKIVMIKLIIQEEKKENRTINKILKPRIIEQN
jgi:hypothetical protein